jgi:phenylacetate-CoA ligase
MHALAVIYVLREVAGISEFRIVQHTVHDLEVQLVPGAEWKESGGGQIQAGLKKRLGADTRIDLRLVDNIPSETSGKHRYVVSHVPLPTALKLAVPSPID